jgi:hypothetical protein
VFDVSVYSKETVYRYLLIPANTCCNRYSTLPAIVPYCYAVPECDASNDAMKTAKARSIKNITPMF